MQGRVVFKQFMFLASSNYVGVAVSIVGGLWLTRLLVPADFGIVAASLFYLSCFNWVSELGWDQSFMAHKEIPLEVAASTHLMIRIASGLLPLIVFCACKLLGFGSALHNHFWILMLLGVSYLCEKMSVTPKVILERNYKLGQCAVMELAATALSYTAAVVAAYHGWGVMSLVMQRLVEKMILCIGYFSLSPWRWGTLWSWTVVRKYLASFGMATWLGSLVGLIIYDFMAWFISWYTTAHQAGLYAKAFNLATFPLILTAICSRLTIPLYTQHQFDTDEIRTVFVNMQLVKMLVLIPMQCGLALTSSWWIPRFFGAAWAPLVPVYMVMCLYGLARAFFDDVPNVLTYGFKNPWGLTKSQAVQASMIIIVGPLTIPYLSAAGGAITMSVAMVAATLYLWHMVFAQLACTPQSFRAATRVYAQVIQKIRERHVQP
jgi:PST family polysaccharide transporter